jgi:hypothetical protein
MYQNYQYFNIILNYLILGQVLFPYYVIVLKYFLQVPYYFLTLPRVVDCLKTLSKLCCFVH